MVLTDNPVLTLTVKLAADSIRHGVVQHNGGVPDASTDNVLGVARFAGKSGDYVPVTVLGVATVIADGAIAVGDAVMPDTSGGRVLKHAGTNTIIGRALTAAAAAGDKLSMMLIPN